MSRANDIINGLNGNKKNIKYVRKEQGLIERTNKDDERIILAEDNRQILFG